MDQMGYICIFARSMQRKARGPEWQSVDRLILYNTTFCNLDSRKKGLGDLCRNSRPMSGLVNCDTRQTCLSCTIHMSNSTRSGVDSAASSLDVLQLRLRTSTALPQTLCDSGSELYRLCMQSSVALGLQKKVLEFSGV